MSKRFEVFTIIEPQQGSQQTKSFWMRCGSAWENKDGSLNVVLDTLPLNGKLNIREPKPRDPGAYQGQNNNQRNDGDF